jgi:ribosomal protein S8
VKIENPKIIITLLQQLGFINTFNTKENGQNKFSLNPWIHRRSNKLIKKYKRRNQQVPNFTRTEEVKSSAFSVLASPKSPM